MSALKVGFLGAGPATQAIHLPTLARLGDAVRVTEVMDTDAGLARAVAARCGARATSSLAEMLTGSGIDIAVVCSPNAFHTAQVEALCAAGVTGILAEKPVAVTHDEARRVAAAVTHSGTALVVGAMHTYDPAWLAAREALEAPGPLTGRGPFHARSAVYIPNNDHFEDMATTMIRAPRPAGGATSTDADLVRGGVMGLAIHNLPLIRVVLPRIERVVFAAGIRPWGYTITATGPDGSVDLLARVGGTWQPDWTLGIWGADVELQMSFPPSYVLAGSAVATLCTNTVRTDTAGTATAHQVFGPYATSGYEAEWRELLAIIAGAPPRYGVDQLIGDVDYAIDLADLAVAALSNSGEVAA